MFAFIRVLMVLLMCAGAVQAADEFTAAFAKGDLKAAEKAVETETGQRKLIRLAGLKAILGDFDGANALYEEARGAYDLEPEVSARLVVAQAIVAFMNGRRYGDGAPTEALDLLTRAKDILGKEDLAVKMVEAEISGYSSKANHVTQSYMGYMNLLAGCQKAGDSLRVGHCAMRLGRVDGTTGGHGGALRNFERAAHIFEAAGDQMMHAWALRNMGHAQRKLGHYDVAQALLMQALDLARQTETRGLEVRVLNDLSRMAMERGNFDVAVAYEKDLDAVLRNLQMAIDAEDTRDSVRLDFYHLLKLRYASLLPYETDLYVGFYDQLIWAEK